MLNLGSQTVKQEAAATASSPVPNALISRVSSIGPQASARQGQVCFHSHFQGSIVPPLGFLRASGQGLLARQLPQGQTGLTGARDGVKAGLAESGKRGSAPKQHN